MSNSKRNYIAFNPSDGYPARLGHFYECMRCGDVVPSVPKETGGCRCDNIFIDVDAGRIAVKDVSRLKLFSAK